MKRSQTVHPVEDFGFGFDQNLGPSLQLLALHQCNHAILKIICPCPAPPKTADTHIFIGSNLFRTLMKQGIAIQIAVATLPLGDLKDVLTDSWKYAFHLLLWIDQQETKRPNQIVDAAFRLLYLLNGMLWHCIIAEEKNVMLVKGFAPVPRVEKSLAECCCHYQRHEPPLAIVQRLTEEVRSLLNKGFDSGGGAKEQNI